MDVLVNNAGFGVYGLFAETSIDRELEMIQVNVAAPTHLTKLILPGMRERRRGWILNVASTAAFPAGPFHVRVLRDEGLHAVLLGGPVERVRRARASRSPRSVPGPTRTEFESRAGSPAEITVRKKGFVMSASEVAREGWTGMKAGKRIVIPGLANRLLVQAERVTPRRLVTAMSRRIREPHS